MNAKRKVVGILGFTAHCVFTIPIVICDVVRTIVGYYCVDDLHNEFSSAIECVRSCYGGLGYTMGLVYKQYMGQN